MNSFVDSYKNSFSYAKTGYLYINSLMNDSSLNITTSSLTSTTQSGLLPLPGDTSTDSNWNLSTINTATNFAGLFSSIETVNSYILGIKSNLKSSFGSLESQIKTLESQINSIGSFNQTGANTVLTLIGGDNSWVEQNPSYYTDIPQLQNNTTENIFSLNNTGVHSAVRLRQGFGGKAVIDYYLNNLTVNGNLNNIHDNKSTFTTFQTISSSPFRVASNDVPWLPNDYTYGMAMMLTYYMDRPTRFSEVFIDPVTTNPFYLAAITWAPAGISNLTSQVSVYNSFSHTYSYSYPSLSYINSTFNSSNSIWTVVSSGYATYTFPISTNLNYTQTNGELINASVSGLFPTRFQLQWDMQSSNILCGGLVRWFDTSGNIISTKRLEDYADSSFKSFSLLDYVPSVASSGQIQIGILTYSSGTTGYFTNPVLTLGEDVYIPSDGVLITSPTTVPIPGEILSNRISFILMQTDPTRQSFTNPVNNLGLPTIIDKFISRPLQDQINQTLISLANPIQENNYFVYTIGLKELDLRYREYVPHGRLVSKPVSLSREIRNLWVNLEVYDYASNSEEVYIYPYEDNSNYYYSLTPNLIENANTNSPTYSAGEVLTILTQEEIDAGYGNSLVTPPLIAPIYTLIETYPGTDSNGLLTLNYPPHTRRVKINTITSWLNNNSIWPEVFDPNCGTLYSLDAPSLISAIRSSTNTSLIDPSEIVSFPGYNPISVTVKTNNYTANPDSFGKPQNQIIKVALNEVLTFVSNGTQVVNTSTVSNSGNSPTTTSLSLSSNLPNNGVTSALNPYTGLPYFNVQTNTTTSTTTQTISTSLYKTQNPNIVSGESGNFIDLYYQNPITGDLVIIQQGNFNVDPLLGSITIVGAAPTGFSTVIANYRYLSNSNTTTYYSNAFDNIVPSAGSVLAGVIKQYSTSYPVTRNMTDYLYGVIPTLNPPNMDSLSSTYYPVIEYYVDADGVIHFSQDFWLEGESPATIIVKSESLKIKPRIGCELDRVVAPTTSTFVKSLSLGVKQASLSFGS